MTTEELQSLRETFSDWKSNTTLQWEVPRTILSITGVHLIDTIINERRAAEKISLDDAAEIARLKAWLGDLQSGMYVNCVYCGHRYGPDTSTPVSQADVLKKHVEVCPQHPMSELKRENERLKQEIAEYKVNCCYGNPSQP